VLGLLPGGDITSESCELQDGDTFVLFTDGVSEAFNPDEELFGEDRLLDYLDGPAARGPRDTTTGIFDAVRRHAAGARQSDDITVVAVRYGG
jgi:phosphoserine phosphatase RsbU/P